MKLIPLPVIERGIPTPTKKPGKRSKDGFDTQFLRTLGVGDSVFVARRDGETADRCHGRVQSIASAIKKYDGSMFTVRSWPDQENPEGVRIWRLK